MWFIGIPIPPPLIPTLDEAKSWMRSQWCCRSGHKTPAHITLVSPFPGSGIPQPPEKMITQELKNIAKQFHPFEVSLDGVGAFAQRTLYIRVIPSPGLDALHRHINETLEQALPPSVLKKEKGPFRPHLTIANRDIPHGAMAPSLEHFQGPEETTKFKKTFKADRLTLYRFDGLHWITLEDFFLQNEG